MTEYFESLESAMDYINENFEDLEVVSFDFGAENIEAFVEHKMMFDRIEVEGMKNERIHD